MGARPSDGRSFGQTILFRPLTDSSTPLCASSSGLAASTDHVIRLTERAGEVGEVTRAADCGGMSGRHRWPEPWPATTTYSAESPSPSRLGDLPPPRNNAPQSWDI